MACAPADQPNGARGIANPHAPHLCEVRKPRSAGWISYPVFTFDGEPARSESERKFGQAV